MCNPRRVEITATRELRQEWEREVERTVELDAEVTGEARVRQSLADVLGGPALRALEMALAEGDPAWRETADGYRFETDGGYALFDLEQRELEIVAVRHGRARAEGSASATVRGEVRGTLEAVGEGVYDDDEAAGRTRERAEGTARRKAEAALDAAAERRVQDAADAAAHDLGLAARAEDAARQKLEHAAEATRAELTARAAQRLENVGTRCRQAFHELLAHAYRDAILAYARSRGAEIVTDHEDGDIVEIEFQWTR